MRFGVAFLALTALLVIVGSGLYIHGWIGWAQLCFVLASGTAGAGMVAVVEEHL